LIGPRQFVVFLLGYFAGEACHVTYLAIFDMHRPGYVARFAGHIPQPILKFEVDGGGVSHCA
jgi:hypothetical protein